MLRRGGEHQVTGLFTTVNAQFDRVAMHAVRRTLLEAQAKAAGLALHVIDIPYPCPNADYERIMGGVRRQGAGARRCGDGVRRSVPGRHPRLSRTAACGHRDCAAVSAVGPGHARAGSGDDRRRAGGACDLRRPAQAGSRVRRTSLSIARSWPICRPASIRAGRTASSTPSSAPGRCFARPCRCGWVTWWIATASCSRTWWRSAERVTKKD